MQIIDVVDLESNGLKFHKRFQYGTRTHFDPVQRTLTITEAGNEVAVFCAVTLMIVCRDGIVLEGAEALMSGTGVLPPQRRIIIKYIFD